MLSVHSVSPFDLVYNAAKEQNEALLKKGVIIDARRGYHTPASKLAEEGNNQAVLLLVENGASPHLAAMGAAMGKNFELADILRKHYGANINFIAKGAAFAGDSTYLDLYGDKAKELGIDMTIVAEGAAMGGHIARAEQVRELFDAIHPNLSTEPNVSNYSCDDYLFMINFLSRLASAAVSGGNLEYAIKLQKENSIISLKELGEGAALTGSITHVEELSHRYPGNNDRFLALAASYAEDKEYCLQLLENDKWENDIHYCEAVIDGLIQGCVKNGNFYLLEELKLSERVKKRALKEEYLEQLELLKMFDCSTYLKNVALKNKNMSFFLFVMLNSMNCGYFNNFINKTNFISVGLMNLIFEADTDFIGRSIENGNFALPISLYNNISFCEKVRKQEILNKVRQTIKTRNLFSHSLIAQHQFSFINDHEFLRSLKNSDPLKTDPILEVIPTAIKINEVIKKYDLNYDQASRFVTDKKLRELILFCFAFNMISDLAQDVFISALQILSSLSRQDTQQLCEKVSLKTNKLLLSDDIESYKSSFWINHRQRANSFLQASEKTKDRKSLQTLIKYQKDLFDGVIKPEADSIKPEHEQPLINSKKDDYYNIIEKNYNRLK